MDRKIDKFLAIFTGVRRLLQKLGTVIEKRRRRWRVIAWLVCVALAAVAVVLLQSRVELMLPLMIIFYTVFIGLAAYRALHACRSLLLFWLIYGAFFALCAAGLVQFPGNIGAESVLGYVVFTIVYTLIWLLLAGAADDAPALMGCSVINTMTTIAFIVINVLAVWGDRNLPLPAVLSLSWNELQYGSVIALLPLVVGGYLAALLKQFQIYWKNRTPAIPAN